jgi:hypothetical protein
VTISDWAAISTAAGTFAAAAAAVWVALWTDRRATRRIREEREHSKHLLAEEQARSRAEINEERRVAQEREQFTEAYTVHVVLGEMTVAEGGEHGGPGEPVKRLAVMVVNHGAFTITGLEAQFCYDGVKLGFPERSKRLTGFGNVRERLREGWNPSAEHALDGVLTPRDAGVRFESYMVPARELGSPYPLVRWIDRWGTKWEHRRGEVRRLRYDEPWSP